MQYKWLLNMLPLYVLPFCASNNGPDSRHTVTMLQSCNTCHRTDFHFSFSQIFISFLHFLPICLLLSATDAASIIASFYSKQEDIKSWTQCQARKDNSCFVIIIISCCHYLQIIIFLKTFCSIYCV